MTHPRRSRHRVARAAAGSAVLLTLATAFAPGAAADAFTDGQWYATAFKLADNHTIADGSGVTVALIDGLIDPDVPALRGADVVPAASTPCVNSAGQSPVTGSGPAADHATNMASMIVGQGGSNAALGAAPGAKLLTYTVGYGIPSDPLVLNCPTSVGGLNTLDDTAADAINDAVAKGARIVNLSFSGAASLPAIQTAILFGMRKGVVFVGATNDKADDQGSRLEPPAAMNGVVAVNGIDSDAKLIPYSASGDPDGPLVVASGPGGGVSLGGFASDGTFNPAVTTNGSSSATAFVSGALAVTLSHFPKATGNQLIQSLARNTGGEEHGLDARALDGYGYGVLSLTSMLQHDPTAYPDVNPTLRDGADPSTAEILQGSTPSSGSPSTGGSTGSTGDPSSAASSPSSSPVAAAKDSSSSGLFVGLGIGLVVLLIVVAVVVLVVRRGRSGRAGPPGPGSMGPGSMGQGPPMPAGGAR